MCSPRLYIYRDSCVLYIPTVHVFGSVFLTHSFGADTHVTFPPPKGYPHRMRLLRGHKTHSK